MCLCGKLMLKTPINLFAFLGPLIIHVLCCLRCIFYPILFVVDTHCYMHPVCCWASTLLPPSVMFLTVIIVCFLTPPHSVRESQAGDAPALYKGWGGRATHSLSSSWKLDASRINIENFTWKVDFHTTRHSWKMTINQVFSSKSSRVKKYLHK